MALHEQFWQTRLICPGGGQYVWNEEWQTMESTVYGCPAAPQEGPLAAPVLQSIKSGNFGLTFEDKGCGGSRWNGDGAAPGSSFGGSPSRVNCASRKRLPAPAILIPWRHELGLHSTAIG